MLQLRSLQPEAKAQTNNRVLQMPFFVSCTDTKKASGWSQIGQERILHPYVY